MPRKPATPKTEAPIKATETVAEVGAVENKAPEKKKTYKAKSYSLNDYITVRNGFNGKLVYKSSRTGERFVWDGFGAEQEMEVQELKSARNSSKAFFENNWFMFDDPGIIEFLGVQRMYANALTYEDFDTLFEMNPDEIEERIALLSKGQKASVAYRARQLINEGKIDSIKVINALEKSLGIDLIEK
jgi:hypothetical protein